MQNSYNSILETIGNTPLVRLRGISGELKTNVFAKLEGCNPGHSAKDRLAKFVIEAAEKNGELQKGGTIIETTSGNTGRSLAMIANLKGYECSLFTNEKISEEKKSVLEALGAEVVVCPTDVAADHPDSYYEQAKTRHSETPNSIYINQYYNQANVEAHYKMTGPEIWEQTEGKITHFVCCVGTGGTISGTAKFLKEKNPDIIIIGVDAVGSVLTKFHREGILDETEIKPYQLEGVGKNIIPSTVHFDLIDEMVQVEDAPSLRRALDLARNESILAGPSGGAAIQGLFETETPFSESDLIVTLLPDHGVAYLSKLYNKAWRRANGFAEIATSY